MQEPITEIDANLASLSLLHQALDHHQSGRLQEAERVYLQILKQQPTHLDALHNLGTIACQSQKFDNAINYFQQVLTYAPQRLDTHTNLAHALKAIGNLSEAVNHYELVLEASPNLADIHFKLGQLLATQERLDEAIAHYQKTIDLQPQNIQAYLSLSDVAISQQQLDVARSCLHKLIDIQPDCADAYWNLCALMRQTDDYVLWRQTAEKYVQFCDHNDPIGSAIALTQAYYKTGMHSEALEQLAELEFKIYRDGNILSEKDIGRIYFLILFAIVRLRDDLPINSRLAKLIGALYAQNAQRTLASFPKPLPRSSSSDRTSTNPDTQPNQLRIGFISVNFRRHPVGWCSADTIKALAKLTPHIYLYATSKFKQDDRTQVFEAIACKCNWQEERWSQQQESETFNNLSDLIAEIEQDDLDVLIDLDSLTASRHPEILIRKPARLCVSWLGFDAPYLCSDNYNLGDRHTHPLGIEDFYIERTLRLPDSHMAVAGFPSVKIDSKAQRRSLKLRIKDVIYLCVIPSIKLNRDTVEAHIQILKSVPNSVLLYKGRGDLDIVKSLYHQACTAQGIDRKRIKFLTLTSTEEEHRSIYAVADVMLDSYPYNGGSHTLEALWFDLPVVTRMGEQSFARMGYSFLTTLGIIDGIAQSWDDYIQWGIRLGKDKVLRDSTRQRLIKSKQPEYLSPLWNPTKLAEDMYDLFAEILEEQREHDPNSEFELGNSFWQAGNMAEAARYYRQAIALQSNRADAWGNLGTVLHGEGKLDEAIAHYQKSLQLNPVNFTIQLNLGKALQAKGNDRAARESYEKAIDIDPNQINPYNRLGDIFFAQHDLDRAFACFQRAIEIEPTYAFSHGRLGVIHLEWHQLDLAIDCFRRSILHNPEYANAHVNLSLALLLKGEYQEGFLEYEWRWRSTDILNPIPNYLQPSQPLWDGSNFSGQTLLVYAEQGLGDTIQFIRYIPLVKELGGEHGRILFDCPESLTALLSQISGISLVDSKQSMPHFDLCVPLLSLPRILGTNLNSIPSTIPYLFNPSDHSVELGELAKSTPNRLRIGIVWATCSSNSNIRKRSCPLPLFCHLIDCIDRQAIFYSLQKEIPAEEIELFESMAEQIVDLRDRIDNFADTASIIAQMDLVISIDTAVAHLAGAMGKPVWVILPFSPDWRWMLDREDSPWYPTMRLFRQKRNDDWADTLEGVAEAVKNFRPRDIIPQLDFDALLQSAIANQQAGRLSDAAPIYQQILQQQPDNFNALYLAGVVAWRQGNSEEAIDKFHRTIALKRDHAEAHKKLGDIFKQQSRTEEAIACYQQAIAHKPAYYDALFSLGVLFGQQNNFSQASIHYQQAISVAPQRAEVYGNLGVVMYKEGKIAEAIASYRKCLEINPQNVLTLCNLAVALSNDGQLYDAIECCQTALKIEPNSELALYNLGYIYQTQENTEEAIATYQKVIELNPNYTDAYIALGNIYSNLHQYEKAIIEFQHAIAVEPTSSNALNWLGFVYLELNQVEPAIATFKQAITCHPNYVEAHMNLGLALLISGNYAEGLVEYEWRSQRSGLDKSSPHFFPHPLWDGNDLEGRTLLVFGEQGFGDLIQFIRYIPQIKARAGQNCKLIFDCQSSLNRLFSNICGLHLAPRNLPLPQFNVRISLLSLPYLLGTTLETIPATVPYLSIAEDINLEAIQKIGNRQAQLKVGLVWASKQTHSTAPKRSCHLTSLLPLFDLPDIYFYGLQKEISDADRQLISQHHLKLTDLSNYLGDFADTAAIINHLDLIITVDTSVAHLAGALGKPVWVLLPFAPDWRWLLEREDSPWYPTMRLFRQSQIDNWESAIDRVFVALSSLVARDSGNLDANTLIQMTEVPDLDNLFADARKHHLAKELKEAQTLYLRLIRHQPHHDEAWHMLGVIDIQSDRLKKGVESIQKALEINPHNAEAHSNLGYCHSLLGQMESAIAHYRQAIALDPDLVDAHKNLGLALLTLGDLKQGFIEYEWRWQSKAFQQGNPLPPFSLWDGEDLLDRTLLVYCEQGLGDAIQFSRYIPLIVARGGNIIIDCPESLKRLFSEIEGVNIAKPKTPMRKRDFCIPLMSLPHVFGTTLETIPAQVPYLSVPSQAKANLNLDIFNSPNQFKVGFVCASKPDHATSRDRSCPIAKLKPLFDIPKISFYSLQKEISTQDREIFDRLLLQYPNNFYDLSDRLHDFADTAAIIEHLDLVISVDTAVAHLAGALGKPTWVMLPFVSDWRWMLDREDSPWYPTMRLFRQQQRDNWAQIIDRIVGELKALPSVHQPQSPQDPQLVPSQLQGKTEVGIGWSIGAPIGWGIFGLNLALQMLKTEEFEPCLLVEPFRSEGFCNPLQQKLLEPAIAKQQEIQQIIAQNPGRSIYIDIPILHALDNLTLKSKQPQIRGKHNIGYIFFEGAHFYPEAINTARSYDLILAGSKWNADKLSSYGLTNISHVIQGIDPTIFHPAPRSNLFGDRFLIFSGGKLEYRKAQDIVVAAFRIFQARHPDALLLTAWHNFWPEFMVGIDRNGHVVGVPTVGTKGKLEIEIWLLENGLPAESFIDLGLIPNHIAPQIMREADVALFPNRCEGGTNLVAMECLACGVPAILSANTGHLDLINDSHCYPLNNQKPVRSHPHFSSVEDWGESDIEDVVETLEYIYANREEAKCKGKAAAVFMQELTWEKQVNRILSLIKPIIWGGGL